MLAGEPLHPRGVDALPSTVGGEASPRRSAAPTRSRARTRRDLRRDARDGPAQRARRRARRRALEAYLDGDRDVARRKTMAIDLVWPRARCSIDGRPRARRCAPPAARSRSTRSPRRPRSSITALVLEPPKTPPPELRARARRRRGRGRAPPRQDRDRRVSRRIAAFLPLTTWNGVRHWDIVLAASSARPRRWRSPPSRSRAAPGPAWARCSRTSRATSRSSCCASAWPGRSRSCPRSGA